MPRRHNTDGSQAIFKKAINYLEYEIRICKNSRCITGY